MITLPTLNKSTSPWQDPSLENLFRTELSYASEPIDIPFYKSLPALKWVNSNNASKLLFKGLAKFSPLYPTMAYKNQISAWLSPPPSGYNNTVLIVLGKDSSGKKRLIGSNYANWPRGGGNDLLTWDFFSEFDQLTSDTAKETLIFNTVSSHMTCKDIDIAKAVLYQSEVVRTMPIALLVLDATKSYMAFSPAVVHGNYPADFSKEFMGEIL